MRIHRFLIGLFVGLVIASCYHPGQAQVRRSRANFSGEWQWAVYAKSRDELPPLYRNEKLADVPGAEIYLILKQRGKRVTGEYYGSRRFLARLEEGDIDTTVNGNTTTLELTSGFGGTMTALLTLRDNRIHWKMVKSEGEYYFPEDVYLRRVVKRRGRR